MKVLGYLRLLYPDGHDQLLYRPVKFFWTLASNIHQVWFLAHFELHPSFQPKLLQISSTMLSKLKKHQVNRPSIPLQKRKNCHYNILSDIHDSTHCRNWLQDINKNKGVFVVDWLNHRIMKVSFKGSMNTCRHKATKNWDFGILNHPTWLLASNLEKVLLEKFLNVSYPLMTRWNWQ